MPRKATGNVRQHASGWWEARTTRDGQAISRYGRTAEEANAKLREARAVTKDAGISLHHLLDEWLKMYDRRVCNAFLWTPVEIRTKIE